MDTIEPARLRMTDEGLVVDSDGWFVVNVADARAFRNERGGTFCSFEGADNRFPEFGLNIHVLEPGQPNGMYHREEAQEAFMVLAGECVLLIEGEERRLRPWDFVYCPPGTTHIFVGAGNGPCAILMVGTRGGDRPIHYPVSDLAARHGASVSAPTDSPAEAYRDWPREFVPERMTWPPR